MKKKLMLLLCLITCMFAITACSAKEEAATFQYDEATVKETATQWMDSWNQMDFKSYDDDTLEQLVSSGQMDEATKTVFASWRQAQTDIGAFVETKDVTIKEAGDKITVVITVKYEKAKNDVEFRVPFDSTLTVDSNAIVVEEIETLGSKMQDAGLNTILGMGTVFVVLIFISFMIGLFRFIPMIQEKMSKKQETEINVVEAIDNTMAQIAEQEEEQVELVDDGELVAVITAAIMASMTANGVEIPADGLVVRSIKRAKSNKWQKA
ncbi:OadG family transporter subunit [Anaerosporobacter sp.]|uniref:OadG family transporter subunit n=1 Tax=Anaerosporobacter sp. TaxID=1872529 RepID=UPI00286F9710|nr:OadG family transporter subunit [Anaerosporobacter sp.]